MNKLQIEQTITTKKGHISRDSLVKSYLQFSKLGVTKFVLNTDHAKYEVGQIHNYIEVKKYKPNQERVRKLWRYNMEGVSDSPINPNGKLLSHTTSYYDNGKIHIMIYYSKGKVGRDDDEPAMVKYEYCSYNETDVGFIKIWLKDGNFYERPNKEPNYIMKFPSGTIIEKWCMPMNPKLNQGALNKEFSSDHIIRGNVNLHRPLNEGPAYIEKPAKGSTILQEYHLNGKCIATYI